MKISTNVNSIKGQNALKKSTTDIGDSQAKLASGLRINRAADDAAGLAISEKMKAEIRSSKQASRNANDGISLVQTAEGGLNESSSLLIRMKELAMQSANDTMGHAERLLVENEFKSMRSELDRIARSTEFGGRKLLDGHGSVLDFQVGLGGQKMNRVSFNSGAFRSDSVALGVSEGSILTKSSAQNVLGTIDRALEKLANNRSALGSIQNRLQVSSNNLDYFTENMTASNSRIRDVDYALESANLTRGQIISEAGTAVLIQANTDPKAATRLLE